MYSVELTRQALKQLKAIDAVWQTQIRAAIRHLADDPQLYPGVKAIKGCKGRFRIRVGDYRVVYDVEHQVKILLVLRIGHRGDVYRTYCA